MCYSTRITRAIRKTKAHIPQRVAVVCSMLQCVALCTRITRAIRKANGDTHYQFSIKTLLSKTHVPQRIAVVCSMLQCVADCCSVHSDHSSHSCVTLAVRSVSDVSQAPVSEKFRVSHRNSTTSLHVQTLHECNDSPLCCSISVMSLIPSCLSYKNTHHRHTHCSVYTAVCCSVLQRVAACCSMQGVVQPSTNAITRVSFLHFSHTKTCIETHTPQRVAVHCSMLQRVVACCSVQLSTIAQSRVTSFNFSHTKTCKDRDKRTTVCCNVLQCVAAC